MCQLSRSVLLFLLWGIVASNLHGAKAKKSQTWPEADAWLLTELVNTRSEETKRLPKEFVPHDWQFVADKMPGRTNKRVKERYLQCQDPTRNHPTIL